MLGHAFTFEQVCQVAGIGEQEGLVTLDELLVSQYLSEGTCKEREAYFFTQILSFFPPPFMRWEERKAPKMEKSSTASAF